MGRRPIGTTAMSDAERQRRRRARLEAEKPAAPPSDVDTLRQELAAARDRIKILEIANEIMQEQSGRIGELEAELAALRSTTESAATIAGLQAEIAKLTKDRAVDHEVWLRQAERQHAGLKTRNRNLRIKLKDMEDWERHRPEVAGTMPFATMSAITKVLHPDQRANATDADRDTALKAFTAWKADNSKARRARRS
jgi:hypothetical protein